MKAVGRVGVMITSLAAPVQKDHNTNVHIERESDDSVGRAEF
jgi:hypothetical protein